MADRISLVASPRDTHLNPRALRRAGYVPGVIYGAEREAQSVQFLSRELIAAARFAGTSRLVSVFEEGTDEPVDAFFREVQRDPVSEHILHVDLYQVVAGQAIRNAVPIVVRGWAPVSESHGATISQVMGEVDIECLPKDMPEYFVLDISVLDEPGSRLTVADLTVPEAVTILTDPSADVVQVLLPRAVEEFEEEEAAALEGEEEAEALEGEELEESEEE